MKRRILFVLVAALCLSLFAGCQTQNEVEVTETTTLPPVDPIYNFEVGFSFVSLF